MAATLPKRESRTARASVSRILSGSISMIDWSCAAPRVRDQQLAFDQGETRSFAPNMNHGHVEKFQDANIVVSISYLVVSIYFVSLHSVFSHHRSLAPEANQSLNASWIISYC